jgi:hypothetical protein
MMPAFRHGNNPECSNGLQRLLLTIHLQYRMIFRRPATQQLAVALGLPFLGSLGAFSASFSKENPQGDLNLIKKTANVPAWVAIIAYAGYS